MLTAPTIYLAVHGSSKYLPYMDAQHKPAFLVSYAMMEGWAERRQATYYRRWCMDSGAFSVLYRGATINIDDYIAFCKDQLAADPTLIEIFALDVIRDWRQGLKNVDKMWAAGIPAIPTYHIGEPEDVLRGLARDYPKIGIGGLGWLKGRTVRRRYAEQVFQRVWPCAMHALALTGEDILSCVPWHSCDASSWVAGPRYGTWRSYAKGGRRAWSKASGGTTGSVYDLRHEVAWYLKCEQRVRFIWQKEMAVLHERLKKANWRGLEGEPEHDVIRPSEAGSAGQAPLAGSA